MTDTATTAAALPMSPAGEYEQTVFRGDGPGRKITYRKHLVDEVVRVRMNGKLYRVDEVHVAVDDAADVLVTLIRQTVEGRDYKRRVGMWITAESVRTATAASLDGMRVVFARIATALEPVAPVTVHAAEAPLQRPDRQAAQLLELAADLLNSDRSAALTYARRAVADDVAEGDTRLWAVQGHDDPMTTTSYHALVLAELDRIASREQSA